MTLDVIALLLLGVLSYLGWRTGALGQVLRIVAAVVVLLFGRDAAMIVREAAFGTSGIAKPLIEVASYFIGATLLYFAVVLAGWLVIRAMRSATPTLATMDRAGGALLGAVKGAIVLYIIVAGFVLLSVPLQKHDPDDRMHLRDGMLSELTQKYDIFSPWRVAELESLERLLQAGAEAKEKGMESVVRQHDKIADLLRKEEVRELLEDEKFREVVEKGELFKAFADERVRALLNDKEFVEKLREIDLSAAETALGIERGTGASGQKDEPAE